MEMAVKRSEASAEQAIAEASSTLKKEEGIAQLEGKRQAIVLKNLRTTRPSRPTPPYPSVTVRPKACCRLAIHPV